MLPWYPLGETHGNETLIASRIAAMVGKQGDFWFPMAYFVFWFEFLMIVLYFAFPKQRRFPNMLIGLVVVVDSIHIIRELLKGSAVPSLAESWYWNPTIVLCYTEYLWVVWVEATQYVLLISLALLIYKSSSQREHVNYKINRRSAWVVFVVLFLYPIIYTCMMGGVIHIEGFVRKGPSCAPASSAPPIIGICQCFIASLILVGIVILSLKTPVYSALENTDTPKNIYIWHVIGGARDSDSTQNKKAWNAVRALALIVILVWSKISYNEYYLDIAIRTAAADGPIYTSNSIYWSSSLGVMLGYLLGALVLLWCNKGLHKFIRTRFVSTTEGSRSVKDLSDEGKRLSKNQVELSENI